MVWTGWECSDSLERLKEVEIQTIEPLIKTALGCRKLECILRDWEEGEAILDEEMAGILKEEIITSCNLVYHLAGVAQSLQIVHKVSFFKSLFSFHFSTFFHFLFLFQAGQHNPIDDYSTSW